MLTMNHLKRRGFPLASRCPLCGSTEEDLHHLLVHCSKAWELWSGLLSCADIAWACFYLGRDLLMGWKATPIKKLDRKIWMAAPLYLIWAIWKERNKVVFENAEFSVPRLMNFFVLSIWSWTNIVLMQDFLYMRKLSLLFRS